jgi:hypothetical protein
LELEEVGFVVVVVAETFVVYNLNVFADIGVQFVLQPVSVEVELLYDFLHK